MITILLSTANRPAMLRTALASIASQTALAKIGTVFVSENGGTRDSEAVCAEFPTLPITYIYRTPVAPLEHGRALMRECLQGEMIAILHDDDWWVSTHLATALQALEANPQASSYCTSYFSVRGESSQLDFSGTLFPWFATNYARLEPVWELSRLNVLMASIFGTLAHFSTMVIRTAAMKQASYVYELKNPYDIDRMLFFALSTFGTLLYSTLPGAYIRQHPIQDCRTYKRRAQAEIMCKTTRWLVEASGKSWDVVANSFYQRMALCPSENYAILLKLAFEEWCIPELTRNSTVSPARLKRRKAELVLDEDELEEKEVALV